MANTDPVNPNSSLPVAPTPAPTTSPGSIDVLKDNYQYKILSSTPTATLQSVVNTHIHEGWKLYGNMLVEVIPGFNGSYGNVPAIVTYRQAMIKKLPSKGGARTRSKKNYKKIKKQNR